LDGAYDQGGAGAGRAITANDGAVEITVEDNGNNEALILNQLDTTNNKNAFVINSNVPPSATTPIQHPLLIKSTSAGTIGAFFALFHDSASPANSDQVGGIGGFGKNSNAEIINYGGFSVRIQDVTDASEDGSVIFYAMVAGSNLSLLNLSGLGLTPEVNDRIPLGTATVSFSDLFLAEGGVINWDNGDATLTQAGNLLTLAGAALILADQTNGDGVALTTNATQTLSNKRIISRVGTTTSSATPTINTDNVDEYHLTAQTAAITSFTTNLSGTPTSGQLLFISVTGTAARAITWGASFENGPVALPTTTVTTTRLDVLFKWNAVTSKWRCMATGSTV